MKLCLGDRAQDTLESSPWAYKSRQLCQAWGATTALPERARAQQSLKEQPEQGCHWTYPAPACSPWQQQGCKLSLVGQGRGRRESSQTDKQVLRFCLRCWIRVSPGGGQEGMAPGWQVPSGALGLACLRAWHTALPGWFLGFPREGTSPAEPSVLLLVLWPYQQGKAPLNKSAAIWRHNEIQHPPRLLSMRNCERFGAQFCPAKLSLSVSKSSWWHSPGPGRHFFGDEQLFCMTTKGTKTSSSSWTLNAEWKSVTQACYQLRNSCATVTENTET